MKTIKPSGSDKVIKVDNEDFELLNRFTWYVSDNGYAMTQIRGQKHVKMHHLVYGAIDNPKLVIDHLNNDRLDNRKKNLRLCSQEANSKNRKCVQGYSWDKARNAYIVRYQNKFCGRYQTEEEAKKAFKNACSGQKYNPQQRRRYMLPKGVLYMKAMSKRGRPYYCRPQIKGKKYFVGYYSTVDEALSAYEKLIKELETED